MLLGFLARKLHPGHFLPPSLASWIALPWLLFAAALFVWAALSMSRGGTSLPPGTPTRAIVTSGPYRFSRNPVYVAMLLILSGIGLHKDCVWFLLLTPVLFGLLHWGVVLREERYLERKFGSTYLDYKSRVRRWV